MSIVFEHTRTENMSIVITLLAFNASAKYFAPTSVMLLLKRSSVVSV